MPGNKLATYRSKRDFRQTAEPRGTLPAAKAKRLRYVIQKHAARTLHYDLQRTRENAAFEYTPAWLGEKERFALSPTLPLVAGPQFHKKSHNGSIFHPPIADTEPDGWGRRLITRDHAKRRHGHALTAERPADTQTG